MAFSIRRLRLWLLMSAAMLVLVIAGFLGYARYRTHRFLAGLPGKLGVDIRRETNGYTYSQSVGGKTVMTLHAAKAVEQTGGKITLHDVGMVLYGRKQDRADRISGAEFEYEQATGVVRAVGEVHIDLQAPAAAEGHRTPLGSAGEENRRVIHVKTSGLVYLQKLGVAATDQGLEFEFGGLRGAAVGAEYNSDTGVVILQRDVRANGMEHGRPMALAASHAELERANERALLTDAVYTAAGQRARADHAVLHLRSDGSPERIEADGRIEMAGRASGAVTAAHADVLLTEAIQAQSAHLFGGVRYEDVGSLREGRCEAQEARVAFDDAGKPRSVVLTGAVHTGERVRTGAGAPWSSRDAAAAAMTFGLGSSADGRRTELREAEAFGGATIKLVGGAGTAAAATSELAGDTLRGHFTGAGKGLALTRIDGAGHTSLRRRTAESADETSAGDALVVELRAARKPGAAAGEEIAQATQTGHVAITSRAAAKAGTSGGAAAAPTTTRATAEVAVYDGDADHLTLTGHAQVADEGSSVAANRIVLEHASGDAVADGLVKATYQQGSGADPVHVGSERASLQHASGRAVFFGTAGKAARLWQGGSQVEAPVLELDRPGRSLTAHGDLAGGAAGAASAVPVHAVLASSGAAGKTGGVARPSVVRVASRTMVYRDGARTVEFAGEVKVDDADGTLRAQKAVAYLQPVSTRGGGAGASKRARGDADGAGVLFGGSVDRIVATGRIEMEQPERRATGEEMVYTAADGMFVLTGTSAAPPKLTDEVQGTVTGTELRFQTGDQRITVSGAGAGSQRAHTVTRVKPK